MTPVTLQDVARESGVSLSTASRVLNPDRTRMIRISSSTSERVCAAARRLAYITHAHARSLRQKTSTLVGYLDEDLSSVSVPPIIRGLHAALAPLGKQLVMGSYQEGMDAAERCIGSFRSFRTSAIVVRSGRGVLGDALAELLIAAQPECGPVIVLAGLERRPDFTYVCEDLDEGYRRFFGQLAQARVGLLVLCTGDTASSRASVKVIQEVARRHATCQLEVIRHEPRSGSEFSRVVFDHVGSRYRQTRICLHPSSDHAAFGLVMEARERGIRVPEDLAIVGRGNQEIAAESRPGITTFDCAAVAHRYCTKIAELFNGLTSGQAIPRERFCYRADLIVRETFVP